MWRTKVQTGAKCTLRRIKQIATYVTANRYINTQWASKKLKISNRDQLQQGYSYLWCKEAHQLNSLRPYMEYTPPDQTPAAPEGHYSLWDIKHQEQNCNNALCSVVYRCEGFYGDG